MTIQRRKVRIGPLDTIGHVVVELGRVYRQARRGDMDTADATRLAMILREIRTALEAGDIERRLDALEGPNETDGHLMVIENIHGGLSHGGRIALGHEAD